MAHDVEAFLRSYLPDPGDRDLGEGWRITKVQTDRSRPAIDVIVDGPDDATVLVFVERRIEGAECFASTRWLNVSYYLEPDGPSERDAGRVLQRLVRRLAEREAAMGEEDAAAVLDVGARRDEAQNHQTLEVRINRECNERCSFCNTPEHSETILPGPEQIIEIVRRGRDSGYRRVLFTGREPTLDKRLPEYLSLARDVGYAVVRVQSNGTSFASRDVVSRLVAAGMTETEISLHTLSETTFHALIGKRSLLNRTLEGIRNVVRAGVRVRLVVVVTRLNLGEIGALLRFVAGDFDGKVRDLTLSPMAPVGDGLLHLDLLPRFSALRAELEPILRTAAELDLNVEIPARCGMPLCVTPPAHVHLNGELRNPPGAALEAAKHKPPTCAPCAYHDRCAGVWKAYLQEHGGTELVPVVDA